MPVLLWTNRARTQMFTLHSSISRSATIIGSFVFIFLLLWFIIIEHILIDVWILWTFVQHGVSCSPTVRTEDYLFVPTNLIFLSHIKLFSGTHASFRGWLSHIAHGHFGDKTPGISTPQLWTTCLVNWIQLDQLACSRCAAPHPHSISRQHVSRHWGLYLLRQSYFTACWRFR